MIDYKNSGVDIEAGYEVVEKIRKLKRKKHIGEYGQNIGWFAGGFDLTKFNIKNPVLFSSTDGVGTKLLLAQKYNYYQHIGQDLVAMSVNDLICHNARPLFFLDYIACNKIVPSKIEILIKSMVTSLNAIKCPLLGGETAEMNDMYREDDVDLAGMAVGVCEKENIVTGIKVKPGDVLIGVESSGFHSNGYSLIRKVLDISNLDVYQTIDNKTTILDALMAPTHIYVKPILEICKKIDVHALAHITGGGLKENLERIINNRCYIQIDTKKITPPKIFEIIRKAGNISFVEMYKVFNMGIGFVIILKEKDAQMCMNILKKHKLKSFFLSKIINGEKCVDFIW